MNEGNNRTALSFAALESTDMDEPLAAKKAQGLDSRVDITVISYRKFNHDPDGVSAKAVLDGLTREGFLHDDSTKEVRQITFKSYICEKGQDEKTIIEIES